MSHTIRADYRQRLLLPPSIDEWVGPDHPARFVRDLVESLDLPTLGFGAELVEGEEGRPHYAPELLLSVWLYGWMERVRSSRALEMACMRDVAFLWLTGNHHPDHVTLWRFFRQHRAALRKLFRRVVQVAVDGGLVGFALHALDGTKLQAASSMQTAMHRKSLEEQLKQLDAIVEQSMQQTEQAEQQEDASYPMPAAMQAPEARKRAIRESLAKLDAAETSHLHPNEPDARTMRMHGATPALGFNAQIVVDHDSDLVVAADVSNEETDHAQLVPMMSVVLESTGRVAEQTVADAGYYSGEQIDGAERRHLPVLVNEQSVGGSNKGEFDKSQFRYDGDRNGYTCPRGEFLPLETTAKPTTGRAYPMSIYRCRNRECPVRAQCTKDARGRSIKRTPYEEALSRQADRQQGHDKQVLLALRKEIVEHVFGIVKGIDGFRRFTMRGLEAAKAQWALICLAVNVRKLYAFWRSGQLQLAS